MCRHLDIPNLLEEEELASGFSREMGGRSGKLLKTDGQPSILLYKNGEDDSRTLKRQTVKIPKRNEQPLWILKGNGKLHNLNAPLFRIFKRN